ncbi:hypothetical protein DYB32_000351 [Aphanomyces invadans]|uniref:L-type lectin-like domain-containing protein n=1 Tax=Aphanomyces invadans TaxID=157072 RepID=A0A418BAB4_9STRA|nr:hypothetical protein DYB32_000351 [Aphanomyces invadans]
MKVHVILACLLAFVLECASIKLDAHSFAAPFKTIDRTGKRIVNSTWTNGGSTEVFTNFIRLTPDRQSKHGHVWNNAPLQRNTFSAVLQFRISGQGQKWFGDGIGLWLTNSPHHEDGDNHGFKDKYFGVGIIIDTFVNSEHKGGHKDVTIQINDGTKTTEVLQDETKIGCDAALRYHEDSAHFDPVFSSSRLRVVVDGVKLKLEVDAKSTAEWKSCYEGDLPLPSDWLQNVSLGITGSTGGLADNHDILSFLAFSDADDIHMQMADSDVYWNNYSKEHHGILKSDHCDNSCKLIILEKSLENSRVDLEHQLVALKERTTKNIQKVKLREIEIHEKLADMNRRVDAYMKLRVNTRLDSVALDLEKEVHGQVSGKVEAAGGWQVPFLLVSSGVLAGSFYVYRKYKELRKSHLL